MNIYSETTSDSQARTTSLPAREIRSAACAAPDTCSKCGQTPGSEAQRGGDLTSCKRPIVLAHGDLHPSHGHESMTAQESCKKDGTVARYEDLGPAASTACDSRASVPGGFEFNERFGK